MTYFYLSHLKEAHKLRNKITYSFPLLTELTSRFFADGFIRQALSDAIALHFSLTLRYAISTCRVLFGIIHVWLVGRLVDNSKLGRKQRKASFLTFVDL